MSVAHVTREIGGQAVGTWSEYVTSYEEQVADKKYRKSKVVPMIKFRFLLGLLATWFIAFNLQIGNQYESSERMRERKREKRRE